MLMLQTNLTSADGLPMNISMTAYALIALSRSYSVLTGVRTNDHGGMLIQLVVSLYVHLSAPWFPC